ncbi:MAG: ABC transporter permease, partial [Acidimicrobiia bacterium]|nr:ABC transporter permease [Acidimicrobiia bacterium]
MIKLALRGIRASLGRLVLMTVAIVAGVGFVSGAFILSDSLSGTFTSLIKDATAGTDAQIQAADPEFGQNEVSLPQSLVATVAALPEVGKADPGVGVNTEQSFRPFLILRDDGSRVQPQGGPIISFSWNGDTGAFITSAEGTPPNGIDQTAIDSGYAKAAGVSVGDQVRMATPDGERTFTVTSIVEPSVAAGAYYVLFDLASAQQLFGKVGQVDQIALTRASGVSTADMIAAVQKVLPPEA